MKPPIGVLIVLSLALCTRTNAMKVGAEAYTGKDPIGGGSGYTRYVSQSEAAFTVTNVAELRAALAKAKAGDIVYVADGAEIDATGERDFVIPGGVTLAGNRGEAGAPGPLIRADELNLKPNDEEIAHMASKGNRYSFLWRLFWVGGPGVRVTGLRIQGPDTQIGKSAYLTPNCRGIDTECSDLEVDNCEMWGWSHAAIAVRESRGIWVHHCDLHHCRRAGLGYGVSLTKSQAFIEANRFAENRHDIAGTGECGTSYVARYNISEANDPRIGHAFDMHGQRFGSQRDDGSWRVIAGDSVVICFNTFRSCEPGIYIMIRGEPRAGMTVFNNVYENAHIGGSFWTPCRNAIIHGDQFVKTPQRSYYTFAEPGNLVNGKRMPKGDITTLP